MRNFLYNLFLIGLAALVFLGSLFYEDTFSVTEAKKRSNQAVVIGELNVNRDGEIVTIREGEALLAGDALSSGESDQQEIAYSEDGRLRLDADTRVEVAYLDEDEGEYIFELVEGRVWLNNLFSNADVNLLVPGAVINPQQSIAMVELSEGKSLIYSNTNNVFLNIVDVEYQPEGIINRHSELVANSLLLPQGTQATVFETKVAENLDAISQLLFSKMIKEFSYGVFDRNRLRNEDWLTENLDRDLTLSLRVKNDRLKRIRNRGLQYVTLDSNNYKFNQSAKGFYNLLTFSSERVGERNLDFLYSFLYDAQYLFDVGRADEATRRLNEFSRLAQELILEYGDSLKEQYDERVYDEFEYLSFVNPSDSLFGLKNVLAGIYKQSIAGSDDEVAIRFSFLTDKANTLNFHAENNSFSLVDRVYEEYMQEFDELLEGRRSDLEDNAELLQRQNQILNNLFIQYPEFYRFPLFLRKIDVEDAYLDLLAEGPDKWEEMQTIVNQRISFLRLLQQFFLDEEVPVEDARKIVSLLLTEIDNLTLPKDLQVAVSQYFNERLKDFGVFHKFINSPEYVNSRQKGDDYQERFETYKAEQGTTVTLDDLLEEAGFTAPTSTAPLGSFVPPAEEEVVTVDEEVIEVLINDEDAGVIENEVKVARPKVKRN